MCNEDNIPMDKKKLEELTADAELWETGKLGASAEHMRVLSDEETKEIDDGLGLQLISMRLNKALIEQFKELARLEAIGYQPLIRRVLMQYAEANKHKLDSLLSPSQAADKAEKLFAQSIEYRELIPTLAPLSHQRIGAECDYSAVLTNAHALFGQAFEKCKDPLLKRHIRLRIKQISELCDADQAECQDKKNGRRGEGKRREKV
jgi:predicted DNA binding CopG/RHH family protein